MRKNNILFDCIYLYEICNNACYMNLFYYFIVIYLKKFNYIIIHLKNIVNSDNSYTFRK